MEIASTLTTAARTVDLFRRDNADARVAEADNAASHPVGATGPPTTDRVHSVTTPHDVFGRPHGEADDARENPNPSASGDGSIGDALADFEAALRTTDRAQLERIEQRLRDLVDVAPGATTLQRMLAETQRRLGKTREAARTTQAAVDRVSLPPPRQADPGPPTLPPRDDERPTDAIGRSERTDQSAASEPESARRVEAAKRALSRGDAIVALRDFQQALADDPNDVEARRGLAEARLRRAAQSRREGDPTGADDETRLARQALDPRDAPGT